MASVGPYDPVRLSRSAASAVRQLPLHRADAVARGVAGTAGAAQPTWRRRRPARTRRHEPRPPAPRRTAATHGAKTLPRSTARTSGWTEKVRAPLPLDEEKGSAGSPCLGAGTGRGPSERGESRGCSVASPRGHRRCRSGAESASDSSADASGVDCRASRTRAGSSSRWARGSRWRKAAPLEKARAGVRGTAPGTAPAWPRLSR